MNGFFVLSLIVILVLLERNWALKRMPHISYNTESESIMAEKNEELSFVSSLSNDSRLPVTYVSVTEHLPETSVLLGNEAYIRDHLMKIGKKRLLTRSLAIGPLKEIEKEEKYKLENRGIYSSGDYSLYVGDLLGFSHIKASGRIPWRVAVLPTRIDDIALKNIVSGFIGEISVRRFIMEDPIITAGFNEYTGREPFRDISWSKTAVYNKLMVKKYDYTSELRVMILLNIEGGTIAEKERCLELCRMAIEMFEEKHIPYGFRTNGIIFSQEGDLAYVPPGIGSHHYKSLMYGLAGADHAARLSFESLVNIAVKARVQNEHYLVITVPTDAKAQAAINNLSRRTGSELCILVGKEEQHVQHSVL